MALLLFFKAIPNAIDSAVKGDFKDDDGSYSDRVGKIIGGLNPAGDVRDIIANGKGVVEGKPGAWIGLGAAVVGIIPIIGDGGKIVLKSEKKVIAETVEKLVRSGVEKEAAEKIAKEEVEKLVKEAVEKQYDEIAKTGHPVQRHGEHISEQQLDDRAMYGKDPITGTTDDAYIKNADGTQKKHSYGKDATKFVGKDSLVQADNYIKNSQQFKDKLLAASSNGDDVFAVEGIKLEDVFGTN